MHAVIGTTVSLPCNLSPPSPDDSFSLVLWYRLDLPNPIYTLDARSATAPGDATHFANKIFDLNSAVTGTIGFSYTRRDYVILLLTLLHLVWWYIFVYGQYTSFEVTILIIPITWRVLLPSIIRIFISALSPTYRTSASDSDDKIRGCGW
ncbi:ig-like domain-containing protein [Trichonephila inaurata madagascariensis]|uniref:Ig-like domain-containing protein n=1 Tax=Trichonephila inaurata madagascariensis TaxID=2747483 RepID=A0A8X6WNG7_9ARAC|nr:ig-like domain-containing protein [Trichonephila inaurata madagascariensis]